MFTSFQSQLAPVPLHGLKFLTLRSPSLKPPVWSRVPSGIKEPEEHHTSVCTVRGLKSTLRAISDGSLRQFPAGNDKLDLPKSVRSKMTTRSLLSSCMCMAEMPMLGCKSCHRPPPPASVGDAIMKSWITVCML
ncbi:hypothetical protein G4B88_024511 [Cannabis sativa]|uniref:Uncharacterized protein n=1 Tax=Cannabis sativa TaxID=3483 RepID=A0A7J6EU94_CANSA|nr:hypothetical protein G4B88_024511 [Cannabis sativa]